MWQRPSLCSSGATLLGGVALALASAEARRPVPAVETTLRAARRLNRAAGDARGFGAGRQRDRALSRLVPQQGDVDAACYGIAVLAGEPSRHRRSPPRRPCGAGHRLCRRRADRRDRHGLSPLQHQQKARRVLLAEPVLLGTARRAGGAVRCPGCSAFCPSGVRDNPPGATPTILGLAAGRVIGAMTSLGLLGTTGEAGLLHFRGAYHNPAMYLARHHAAGRRAAAGRERRWQPRRSGGRLTRWWLRFTALIGLRRQSAFTPSACPATWAAGATGARTCSNGPPHAGAAELHRPGARRPRGARPAGGPSR